MKRIHFIVFITTFCLTINAQVNLSYTHEELFEEGQYFFIRKDYKEALYYFKQLAEKNKGHANFHFKVGECYLNIPGQEHKAVPYFEVAVKNLVPKKDYRGRQYTENNAPLHALFYLGNAYRVDGQLDKALESYKAFLNSPNFINNYNYNIVENEIKSCERAKIIQDAPVNYSKIAFDSAISTNYSEFNPLISKDGNTLIFVRALEFYNAIFVARKTKTGWSKPININPDLVSNGDYYPTGINSNGSSLLLVRETNDNIDIYFSDFKNNKWTQAKKIPGKINSLAHENYASFGQDDQSIIFTSNRSKSRGGYDIFISKKGNDGSWGKPKNLGKTVNTELDEETPVFCNKGKVLFFSSKGHYSIGGLDVFYSYLEDNKWSVPRNIGYPISTTRDDKFYIVEDGCANALYSIVDPETGTSDIFIIKVKDLLAVP